MTEFEVIRKDAIRLATVVVNLSEPIREVLESDESDWFIAGRLSRRLAEIATELVIKEKLLEMAARLEALAVEDHNGEQ